MPAMATNLKDIHDEFKMYVSRPSVLVAAYSTVEMHPGKLRIWTLLSRRDDAMEAELAKAERKISNSFDQVRFDFSTIHLKDRDPVQFIPEGAVPILVRDERIASHFARALNAV